MTSNLLSIALCFLIYFSGFFTCYLVMSIFTDKKNGESLTFNSPKIFKKSQKKSVKIRDDDEFVRQKNLNN